LEGYSDQMRLRTLINLSDAAVDEAGDLHLERIKSQLRGEKRKRSKEEEEEEEEEEESQLLPMPGPSHVQDATSGEETELEDIRPRRRPVHRHVAIPPQPAQDGTSGEETELEDIRPRRKEKGKGKAPHQN